MRTIINFNLAFIASVIFSTASSAQLSDALMLTVSSGSYSDQTAIRFLDVATNTFDSEWDAYKLRNRGNTPNFCSDINSQTYSINALEGSGTHINQDLSLKLEVAFSGTYTIKAEEIGLFDSTCAITLIDHFFGTVLDLKANKTYTFVANVGDPIDRFSISFKVIKPTLLGNGNAGDATAFATAVNHTAENQGIKIYNNQGTIVVEQESASSTSQVMVRDLSGNSLVQTVVGSSAWNYTPQKNGIYIVSLVIDGNMYTEKVYVQ